MSPLPFANVGPPPGFASGFVVGLIVAAVFMIPGAVLFGLWLSRRKRKQGSGAERE